MLIILAATGKLKKNSNKPDEDDNANKYYTFEDIIDDTYTESTASPDKKNVFEALQKHILKNIHDLLKNNEEYNSFYMLRWF